VTTSGGSVAVDDLASFAPRILQLPVAATGGDGLVIGFSNGATDAFLNGFTLRRGGCNGGAPE
jgi:hypothetical protein